MAIITKFKCGNCNKKWFTEVNSSRIPHGPPNVLCTNCNTINKTGLKWAKDLNQKEKNKMLLRLVIQQGAIYIFLLGLGLLIYETYNGSTKNLNASLGLIFGSMAYAFYINMKMVISFDNEKEHIEQYEKNGGYVTDSTYQSMYSR